LTPFIVVPRARDAIAFYRDVFGARVVDVTEMNGVVAHAVVDFGNGQLQLGEPSPGYHLVPPPSGEDDCYSLGLYCADADAVVAAAEAAGTTIRESAPSCPATASAASAIPSACAGQSWAKEQTQGS
jgi:PhnB protein